jgi:nucleoid DNA-binding protein
VPLQAEAPVKAAKPAAKVAAKTRAKTVAEVVVKKAAPVKAAATDKPVVAKPVVAKPVVAKPVVAKPVVAKPVVTLKPIKTAFTKTSLNAHLAEQSGVDAKATKAVLTALEATILASVHKKGLGAFTLPGLLKISAQHVPAKKKRLGKDPFSGALRTFAAKPASTKIKTRALKKLKDAALMR